MTTDQPGPPTPPNVAALVDAIDARARQAGNDGAAAVVQQMLGSLTDVLSGIADRLDQLEESLAPVAGAAEAGVVDEVRTSLSAFNARLGRLEEAFVQAVDESGSGTQAVVDEVRAVVSDVLREAAATVPPPPPAPSPRVDLTPLAERLDALEQLVRERSVERLDATTAVRAALAPFADRMEALDVEQRATAARHNDALGRVEAGLAAMPGRLTTLEDRVWAVVSSLTEGTGGAGGRGAAGPAVDPTVLARLEDAVDRLDRDEASARLVKLVEERLSAGLRAVTERTDDVRRAVEQLARSTAAATSPKSSDDDGAIDDLVAAVRALQSATHAVPDEVALAIGTRLSPLGDRIAGLDDRLDALGERLAELAARPAPAAPPSPPAEVDVAAVVAQINDAVRREAELLTQRVAALAVGVEAARVLLEQHLQETEATLGRKAGEVTRRLAADFGIRPRRTGPGGRRGDPRELGSGDR